MKNDDLTFGLYGIEGVYNYGCEAIIRGTELILRERWPDITIKYASLRPKDDKKRLKGCNIDIVPRKIKPMGSIGRFNGTSAHLLGLYTKKLFYEDLKWSEDCDAILSIGGDLYTLYPTHKKSIKPFYLPIIHFGENVQKENKKLIIWGSSIGPFDNKSMNYFSKHLKKVDLITSREPNTTDYLKSCGISKNVMDCADPAFALSSSALEHSLNRKRLKIGINFSPLSSYSLLKEEFDEMINIQSKLIEEIIIKFDAEIVLIPHVICDFKIIDDDLRYLKNIFEKLPENILENVYFINKDLGFIKTKDILSTCDIVIATRMHCAINSIEAGIPTIFLSYSQKAKGMAKYVYNNEKWTIPINTDTNELLKLIKSIILQKEDLKSYISQRRKKIKLEVYSPLENLEKLLYW